MLGLLVKGNSNKQIARQLKIEEITVALHLRSIRKLNVASAPAGAAGADSAGKSRLSRSAAQQFRAIDHDKQGRCWRRFVVCC